MSKFLLAATTVAVFSSGCPGNPVGTGNDGQVNVSAKLNNGFSTQAPSTFPAWTSGKVVITNIQFEYQGPFATIVKTVTAESTLDLATGTATPALPAVNLEPGLYKKAKFKLHLKPDALNFEINGIWQGNNIRIENDHQEPVQAMTEEFLVEAGKAYGVNIIVKPNSLLNKADITDSMLQNLTKDANGTILINKNANTNFYNSYIKNKLDKISSFEQTIN